MAFSPNFSAASNTTLLVATTTAQFVTRPSMQTDLSNIGPNSVGTTTPIRNMLLANSSATNHVVFTLGRGAATPTPTQTCGVMLPPSWTQTINVQSDVDTVGILASSGTITVCIAWGNADERI